MAVGDIVSAVVSLTNAASYYIQANSGNEWVIHNIYHAGQVDLRWVTNSLFVCSATPLTGPNIETNLQIHVTNSIFVVLGCNSSQMVGYDGVVTK